MQFWWVNQGSSIQEKGDNQEIVHVYPFMDVWHLGITAHLKHSYKDSMPLEDSVKKTNVRVH